ncbi:Chaperone SurA [Vibrio stylophorae]|uniref:Chaperone SurA n=1 Tax=Vibrio stylophorae TaxID=659351 RepID=A0ABN8DRD1_9VIBR|nr:peptidylprolyl isomerase SurA [Vibrio stylophorae]CAH0532567.1 Chaperone SurA [Vibrio stylophorae]
MKKWIYLCLCVVSLVAPAQAQSLDQVAVIVNDGVILESDINRAHQILTMNAALKGQSVPSLSVMRDQIIDNLIDQELQLQQAKRIGLEISDAQLDEAIARIAKGEGLSVDGLRRAVEKNGVSYADFRQSVRDDMAAGRARGAIVQRQINVLPEEVKALAKALQDQSTQNVQYHLGHIQVKFDESEDAKAAIDQIVKRLNNGADFATLAFTESNGPKALQGGDWGWLRKEAMPTLFADQIGAQGKGAIIGPFRSGQGYHILKIFDVKGLETVSAQEIDSRHILLKTTPILSDAGAKAELERIAQSIRSGEVSFAKMASEYSDDPGSAVKGGNLGWQDPSIFVPEFQHAIETQPIGVIGQPFVTAHGWHIVEVLGRKKVDRTEQAMLDQAYRMLMGRKFNDEAQSWLLQLRNSAYIEVINRDPQ